MGFEQLGRVFILLALAAAVAILGFGIFVGWILL